MFYSAKDIKHIEDFEKYARFLCDHFDISVELDSTKAQTNGKIINLPNVVGLNDEELDMMYAILLHEVGHIKYSSFAEEDFALLKTEFHAFLANAIEDARIENLLMKEFAGARDMFNTLYVKHVQNESMMQKIFKFNGRQPDLFASLAIHIHNLLVKCDTAALTDITSKTNVKQIEMFFKLNNIQAYLDSARLANWHDVIAMTNKIYDLFVTRHRDSSKKTDFAQALAEKKKAQKTLEDLQAKLDKRQAEVEAHTNVLKDTQQQVKIWHDENDPKLQKLQEKISAIQDSVTKIESALSARREHDKARQSLENKQKAMSKNASREQKMKGEITELCTRQNTGQTKTGRKLNDEAIKGLQEKLEKKQKQLETLTKVMQEDNDKLEALRKAYQEASQKDQSHMSTEELQALAKEKSEGLPDLQAEQSDLEKTINQLEEQINKLETLIKTITETARQELLEKMYQMDEIADKQGLPVNMLPEFEETAGWEAADDVQREMDKLLSKERKEIVRNGERLAGALGSNIRDMGVYVDKKAQNVKDLNLLDIFKSRVDFSLLPELNETIKVTKTTTDKSIYSTASRLEKHTVLTTQFDVVRQDVRAQSFKDFKDLAQSNADFANQMKKVFLNKFKFAKKDRFRGGKEEGQLDSRNLWKLATRHGEDYFEQNQPKFVSKMAASILIDISGSQDKEESAYGEKIKALVHALSEALDAVHVKHEVLGYHAPINDVMRATSAAYTYNRRSNALETVVYKNFKQKENSGIANIELQLSDNSDGESVRIATRRLKRETAKSRVMFVVFDGKPFLSDGDVALLDEDLRAALREAVKDKVQVFGFGFSPDGEQFFGDLYCHIKDMSDALRFIEKIDV